MTALRAQDYCWDDHGYALVSRYFPTAAPLLDKQFVLTYELTYETFSSTEGVSTIPFRRAVWCVIVLPRVIFLASRLWLLRDRYYVHRIFGICNDDYDYRQVNVFLPKAVKAFVKKVACFPESVTKEDFDTFSVVFSQSEKVHICLLALEARKQAGLLHGLHAIMKYMT